MAFVIFGRPVLEFSDLEFLAKSGQNWNFQYLAGQILNCQILKEKVTSKKVHFLSTLIKTLDYILATHRSFRLKSAGFPYEIRLQGSPNLDHRYVAAILNSTL